MNDATPKEQAQKMVREAVQWARNSGLTSKEAQAEVATLFGLTLSRIWTLLYKPDTVREIMEDELSKIERGYVNALSLELATAIDWRDYLILLRAAHRQEDAPINFQRQSESSSSKKRPLGHPLWQLLGPCKRPRKAKSGQ
jgi:hypothetical protein